jgi:hypothetical protein
MKGSLNEGAGNTYTTVAGNSFMRRIESQLSSSFGTCETAIIHASVISTLWSTGRCGKPSAERVKLKFSVKMSGLSV